MSFQNMQDYIKSLESKNELKRVFAPVSNDLEITEIADRMSKKYGPALLFENVQGYELPLLINHYGTFERMSASLNVNNLDEIAARIVDLIDVAPPQTFQQKIGMLQELKEISGYIPKKVKKGKCQDKVFTDGALLDRLPILKCWPDDGGPFITLPIVISKDPESGIQNYGMYRNQKFDNNHCGMHWQYNKGGAEHYRKYKKNNQRMEIAIALGGIPSVTYAATAPLPPFIDEMMFAGFLENKAIELVKAKTVDLYVPAESDIIIEGYVEPGDERIEGPFGDHTGFYSPADIYPQMTVTAVTMRQDAVYPATIVGKPPMEDCYMAKATERIFLPLLKMIVPEIVDMNLPMEGVFHNCALISIDKKHAGDAKKVINGLWGMMQMAATKFIAVFDKDTDLNDYNYVVWRLLNNVDPNRDLIFTSGPLDALDHSASYPNYGGKMGIDATRKTKEEGMGREWPEEIFMSEEIKKMVDQKWKEYGIDDE